jgi:anhydro-N-acetylmuramic acid kinase
MTVGSKQHDPNEDMRDVVWAAGCMSGTSLDGVDVAMLRTDGVDIFEFGPSAFRGYSAAEQSLLRSQLGLWEASGEACDLVHSAHIETLNSLKLLDDEVTLSDCKIIGFHGQTFAHDPAGRGTYQAGDGAILAQALDIPVTWDFRTLDVKMGGQGAPLAPFFHHACARYLVAQGQIDAGAPVVFLNLGGVGNLTWVDPTIADPAAEGALLAFDTGPANAPINDLCMTRLGVPFDAGGALAAQGRVDEILLAAFLAHPYFKELPPKSLDRNDFHDVLSQIVPLSDVDAAATLTAMAAQAVVQGMRHCPRAPSRVLTCGGGSKNATLMAMLQEGLACPVEPVETAGLDGDMLEAQAFAYLAMRVKNGLATSSPMTTGVAAAIGGGRVSKP